MPIWLRNFTFQKLNDYYEEQNKKTNTGNKSTAQVKGPDIDPTYNSRASKK